MLSFSLTDDQLRLKERARIFARDVVQPKLADMDRTNQYPWDVVRALAGEGFMGLTIPKEYGGAGRPLIDAILVSEEIAKVGGVIARIVVDSNTAVQKAIVELGTEQQKRQFLPPIVEGDKPVIAITEPEAGSAATWMTTAARRDGDHYVVNGRKCWITGAGVSKRYLIFARFDGREGAQGIGALLVEADTPGLTVPRIPMMMGLRGMPEGEVSLVDCRVPAANVLVGPGDGFKKLMRCYNLQRIGAASVALGIAQGALDLAAQHMLDRKQFGRPIGDFQGLQWMLADMHMQMECSRLLVYRAAMGGANGYPDKLEAAAAKVYAAEAAITVTNQALQIFGAAGYSCDLPIERMVRDARMFTIGGGTAQVQRNLIGKEVLKRAEAARVPAGLVGEQVA